MRRLVVPLIAFLMAFAPKEASAMCFNESFDDAVRTSDAVLVGTIVDARSLSRRTSPDSYRGGGILVSLDVEQVLKGSSQDGHGFLIGSCLPPEVGPYARKLAKDLIGTRGVFLLTVPQNGRPSTVPKEAISPHLSINNQIARARDVLGIDRSWTDRVETFPVGVAAAGILLVAIVIGGLVLWSRRRS